MSEDIEKTNAQLDDIRAEILKDPLLSGAEPLNAASRLAAEFADDTVFSKKVSSLIEMNRFHFVRYARRDGNCFFRCASYELLDLMRTQHHFALECQQQLSSWRSKLIATFGEYSSDFCEVVEEVIASIVSKRIQTRDEVVHACTTEDAGYIIVYFRYLVSMYLREHEEEYLPFVMGQNYTTVEAYCQAEVEPVDHVSDDLQAAAFAKIFNITIEIALLERYEGETRIISINRAMDESRKPLVLHLLFRPGHYDVLEI